MAYGLSEQPSALRLHQPACVQQLDETTKQPDRDYVHSNQS